MPECSYTRTPVIVGVEYSSLDLIAYLAVAVKCSACSSFQLRRDQMGKVNGFTLNGLHDRGIAFVLRNAE
jgi:hypothetical protein